MIVVIASGIPGAGKTTNIRRFYVRPGIVSTDHFFMIDCPLCSGRRPPKPGELLDPDEEAHPPCGRCFGKGEIYHFESGRIKEAHGDCLRRYMDIIQKPDHDFDALIVDNTNTTVAEIAPYVALAEAYGHRCLIVTVTCSIETAIERNVHQVPEGILRKMANNLQERKLPPWWESMTITVD